MRKKFKIKKLSSHSYEAQIEKDIANWIDTQLCNKYYDYKKGHYVNEIQKNVDIEINLRVRK